ncbi:MAG: hypothetical protein ACI9DF_004145 [Verrucomicrobiales bacterium]|jgi:hypothetical protein
MAVAINTPKRHWHVLREYEAPSLAVVWIFVIGASSSWMSTRFMKKHVRGKVRSIPVDVLPDRRHQRR